MANSLFQWLIASFIAVLHPFYVSVIDINHNAKDKSIEVSVRIFTDDFEAVLKKQTNAKVDLQSAKDKAAMEKLVTNYITEKLHIKADGKQLSLKFIGYEQQKESTWSYFEATNIPAVKKIDVDCSLLYDYQEQQINIFHVKANGVDKSYKLDNPKTITSFDL